jgi:uncharacterized membrane protein
MSAIADPTQPLPRNRTLQFRSRREEPGINVGDTERLGSVAVGTALLGLALIRGRSLTGMGLALLGGNLVYRGITGHCAVYGAMGVDTAPVARGAPEVSRSITIGKPAAELYRAWRDPETLAKVMSPFAELVATEGTRQHWRLAVPGLPHLAWNARIVEERDGSLLRWASTPASRIGNEGTVEFRPAPGDRGTEVRLHIRFDPPGGSLGRAAARALAMLPKMAVEKALRAFKSLIETGEIPTLAHNPAAR